MGRLNNIAEIKVNGKVVRNKEDIKYILKRKDNQRKMFLGQRLTASDILAVCPHCGGEKSSPAGTGCGQEHYGTYSLA